VILQGFAVRVFSGHFSGRKRYIVQIFRAGHEGLAGLLLPHKDLVAGVIKS